MWMCIRYDSIYTCDLTPVKAFKPRAQAVIKTNGDISFPPDQGVKTQDHLLIGFIHGMN